MCKTCESEELWEVAEDNVLEEVTRRDITGSVTHKEERKISYSIRI